MSPKPRAAAPSEAASSGAEAPSVPPSEVFTQQEARALRRLLDELELDFERDLVPLAAGPDRDASSATGRGTRPVDR
jgi:hypothetical protein